MFKDKITEATIVLAMKQMELVHEKNPSYKRFLRDDIDKDYKELMKAQQWLKICKAGFCEN